MSRLRFGLLVPLLTLFSACSSDHVEKERKAATLAADRQRPDPDVIRGIGSTCFPGATTTLRRFDTGEYGLELTSQGLALTQARSLEGLKRQHRLVVARGLHCLMVAGQERKLREARVSYRVPIGLNRLQELFVAKASLARLEAIDWKSLDPDEVDEMEQFWKQLVSAENFDGIVIE